MHTNQRKRILLVEDNLNDVELTVAVLKASGVAADVDVVNDGEEAINYLLRRGPFETRPEMNPTLVLLDLKMPRLGGVETLVEIKRDDRLKCLPVVMLTSSGETQDLRMCYRLGANGYVVKPVDAKEFTKAIRDLAAYWLGTNQPPPD
ncbi:MAG: response regulator [Verrucomicrobia bacterium]|nr:response regulator [Verrucomicrobiota bacterium]